MPKIKIEEEFRLDLGHALPELEIVWEEWGDENAPPERTIMVMPALSASCHARSSADDPEPGWWESMIGPGHGIDTDRFRVICASILGSPFGTTSPVSVDPRTGRKYGPHFPQITPADQANVHALLLDHLGLDKVHAVIGSSLGGMQALQFGALHPDRLDVLITIVSTGKTTPGTVALRRVGRLAILLDPDYRDGWYEPDRAPVRGLAIARELGTITYRSRDEFNQRFDWNPDKPRSYEDLAFEVEQYLAHQAKRFTHRFDANCYLVLSRCMDMMDLGAGQPTYADGVLRITAKTLILGVDRDMLIPASEQLHLAHLLENHGRECRHEILSSMYGHDAFLKEYDWFGPRIKRAIEEW
ncbi:MAG: homoserine O-acetyltransferase [Planctomycetota bacterium JB042]